MGANIETVVAGGTITDLVKGFFDCYKEIKVSKEREDTERYRIRMETEAYIARIEKETQIFLTQLNNSHEERMLFIKAICNVMTMDNISEQHYKLCCLLLDELSDRNSNIALPSNEDSMKRIGYNNSRR